MTEHPPSVTEHPSPASATRPAVPGRPAADEVEDSGGRPWRDRILTSTGFDDDEGAEDRTLVAALTTPTTDAALVAAVAGSRLLVAVVAEPGALEVGPEGLAHDASVDMALVVLTAADGTRALPAFTSVQALAAWDATARPVPVTAARAAQAAVTEGCESIVLDVGSARETALRPSMVWALAQQRDWRPAHDDPFVARSVERAVASEQDIAGHGVEDGEPAAHGILRVVLTLRPGLTGEEVREIATRVGERLAADGELRARVDGLAFVLR